MPGELSRQSYAVSPRRRVGGVRLAAGSLAAERALRRRGNAPATNRGEHQISGPLDRKQGSRLCGPGSGELPLFKRLCGIHGAPFRASAAPEAIPTQNSACRPAA